MSENAKGWKEELNLISWNEREPKYDIRDWDEKHEKMGRGVTLSKEEDNKLSMLLDGLNNKDDVGYLMPRNYARDEKK